MLFRILATPYKTSYKIATYGVGLLRLPATVKTVSSKYLFRS